MLPRLGKLENLFCTLLGIALVATLGPGCASLPSSHETDLTQQTAEQPVRGEVVVELKSARGSKYLKAPLKGTMLVQDALRGSGALREFNRMDVVVVRQLPNGGKLRMPVTLNPDTRTVNSATNYALYPDDVVEVTDDPRTMLDRLIDSALSSLGPLGHNQRR